MQVEALTNVGLVRKENEDSYLVSVNRGLFVVADGMGGHLAGHVASSMAVQVFDQEFKFEAVDLCNNLSSALLKANETILRESQANQEYAGMGTTVTAACIKEDILYLAHIGDSRAYLYNNGKMHQLTQDHSLVNALFLNGSISKEEMQNHPQRNVLTRAVGTEPEPQIDVYTYTIQAGDILLLCTDGLHGLVGDHDIELMLSEKISLNEKLHKLVNQAIECGGTDNITVILVNL